MPWLGLPTASWPQAAIGGLWPMERKAMCYKLLIIAVTHMSGSLPQPQQVPGASLLYWGVMTGGSSFQLHLLPTFPVYTLCLSPVILNQSGRLDQNQVYVERDSQVLMCALSSSAPSVGMSAVPKCTCSVMSLCLSLGCHRGILSTSSVFLSPLFKPLA